jgi:hypothetical protein
MPQPKPKKARTSVETAFGVVDRTVLEKLRNSFDTTVLLNAVDAVDQVRYCDDEIRTGILALHGMAMNLLNDNYGAGTPGEEPIDELAYRLTSELLECIEHLQKAYRAVRPLQFLTADPDDEGEVDTE